MRTSQWAICLWVTASLCYGQTASGDTTATPTLKVSPATAQMRASAKPTTQTFKGIESGVTHPATTFAWSLSGAANVTGSLGTIDGTGVYTPPAVPPNPNIVTVTASDSSNKLIGTATITLLDPAPLISSLSTYNINTGLKYTVDVMGSGFLATDQVMLDTTTATSKFVSSTDFQITGTSTAAAGTKIAVTVVDPNTAMGGKTSNAVNLTVQAPVAVTVGPSGRTIRCGATTPLAMTAHVANNSNQSVTWQVNGVTGGNASVGTISTTGAYTPPLDLPGTTGPTAIVTGDTNAAAATTTITVTITAISAADPTASASVTVGLLNPTPVITSVNPSPVNPGAVKFTINGAGFAQDAVAYFAGYAMPTAWVSDKQLTAMGNVTMPFGTLAAIKVMNPNPGTATSVPVVVPVQLPAASVKMSFTDAVKFLQMATWGPTPASIQQLQTMGRDAWLAAQFTTPASTWPDPLNDNERVGRLQSAFFNIAINGPDQLRQRVSFALAQIMVASAIKDTEFSQMVGYQRLLGNDAFGSFRALLGDMTLNPAMGFFLDMVNNDKANPKKNTVANENYAREVMQLFTVGLVQLDPSGLPIPNTPTEYSQQTVTDMAKVMTGWTYAPAPGYASQWTNPPYYFLPMVPFDAHHDMTAKNISLPIPCQIAAGGSAVTDLNQALDCLAGQASVAPFISYRLIQRLVKSNPSPAYVSAVANVFTATQGNLQAVVTAILTNTEATTEGSGKLMEPVLFATNLLRALNASVTTGDGINGQTTAMGQNLMTPGSVFSYFSPFYRVNGAVAPEFQGVNAATSLARANFVWKTLSNGINSNVRVDLTNLQDLVTADPNQLVNAINFGLYRGEMTPNEASIILAAAKGSTSATANVRSALYAAAAAPQYQVQQ